jgi:hypothetical protein
MPVVSSPNMAFTALVAKCPKTGKELQFGQDLPSFDPRFPTYFRVKSVMDFPLTVTRCPISGCGETHTFQEAELQEMIVPGPNPESTEEHSHGSKVIAIEFYKEPDGRYRVWPYVNGEHFVLEEEFFPTKESARDAALRAGREKIEEQLAS